MSDVFKREREGVYLYRPVSHGYDIGRKRDRQTETEAQKHRETETDAGPVSK